MHLESQARKMDVSIMWDNSLTLWDNEGYFTAWGTGGGVR